MPFMKFRHWLIKILACGDGIILNVHFNSGVVCGPTGKYGKMTIFNMQVGCPHGHDDWDDCPDCCH